MLEKLNLPTDSLYKFVCLAGLSIFLAGCFLNWSYYRPMVDSSVDFEMRLSRVERYFKALGEYAGDMVTIVAKAMEGDLNTGDVGTTNVNVPSAPEPPETESVEASLDTFIRNLKAYRLYRNTAYLLMIGGLAIAAIGAYFWYTRIQRYEDQIIKRRASIQE